MRRIGSSVAALLVVGCAASIAWGQEKAKPPPTRIEAGRDTLRTPERPKARPKKPAAPIEIPDVLIYGRDTVKRLVGEKLTPASDSLRVVSPPVTFERPVGDRFDIPKVGLEPTDSEARRTWGQLLGGRFLTFLGQVVHWNQLGAIDYNLEARVGRSDGQFDNDEYARADLGGSVGLSVGKVLHGSLDGTFRLHDYGLQGSVIPDRDRQVASAELRTRWLWSAGKETQVEVSAQAGVLRVEPEPPALKARFGTSTDRWFRVEGRIAWGPSERRLSLAADLIADHFRSEPIPGHDVRLASFWGAGSLALSRQLSLAVTLGVQRENVEGDRETFFAPQAKVLLQVTPRFGFHAAAGRELRYQNFSRLLNQNPYLTTRRTLRPERVNSFLELGVEYKLANEVTVVGAIRNEQVDRYGYWVRVDSTGLFDYARLDDIGLTSAAGGLRLSVSQGLAADVRLVILDDRRGQPGADPPFDLPYRERYQVPFRITFRPSDQVRLSGTSTWVSSRLIRLDSSESLPAYWLLDAELEVRTGSTLAVVVQAKNLTDRRYSRWEGYPEIGVVVLGGVTARW